MPALISGAGAREGVAHADPARLIRKARLVNTLIPTSTTELLIVTMSAFGWQSTLRIYNERYRHAKLRKRKAQAVV
jgi:hypothetical protein